MLVVFSQGIRGVEHSLAGYETSLAKVLTTTQARDPRKQLSKHWEDKEKMSGNVANSR